MTLRDGSSILESGGGGGAGGLNGELEGLKKFNTSSGRPNEGRHLLPNFFLLNSLSFFSLFSRRKGGVHPRTP